MENKEIVIKKNTLIYIIIIIILLGIIGIMGYKIILNNKEESNIVEGNNIKTASQIENDPIKTENKTIMDTLPIENNEDNKKVKLTREELQEFTSFLNVELNNGFLQSEYKNGKEINWYIELICAAKEIGESGIKVNQEYGNLIGMNNLIDTVVYKYKVSDVEDLVTYKCDEGFNDISEFIGENIKFDGNGEYCYVVADGAYYKFVECTEGYKQGRDYIIKGKYTTNIQYGKNAEEYNGFEVKIHESDAGYLFISNNFINM